MKLELNHKKKFGRNSNTWRLKSILLKDEWVNQEVREELKRFMETMKMKIQPFKIFGIQQKQSVLRGKNRHNTSIHPTTGKNSNKKANLTHKGA